MVLYLSTFVMNYERQRDPRKQERVLGINLFWYCKASNDLIVLTYFIIKKINKMEALLEIGFKTVEWFCVTVPESKS